MVQDMILKICLHLVLWERPFTYSGYGRQFELEENAIAADFKGTIARNRWSKMKVFLKTYILFS